jgi:hypothetical protein
LEQSASSVRSDEDHRRAANGYLVWPLALANMVREDEDVSIWARLHARQALVLGVLNSLGFFLVLALPLLAVLAIPGISTGATIAVYAAGLVADAAVGIGLVVVGARYAARAARGELFSIPVVTPMVDRCFRIKRQ